MLCLGGLILTVLLWKRSNSFSDTVVMALPHPWSVRVHSSCGRQVVQFIPEYNSLPEPLAEQLFFCKFLDSVRAGSGDGEKFLGFQREWVVLGRER
jgi:hypothetical protein